jgi:hypothetical protein
MTVPTLPPEMWALIEPAALGRELLGQQAVADRVLWRAADPRHDVGDAERQE